MWKKNYLPFLSILLKWNKMCDPFTLIRWDFFRIKHDLNKPHTCIRKRTVTLVSSTMKREKKYKCQFKIHRMQSIDTLQKCIIFPLLRYVYGHQFTSQFTMTIQVWYVCILYLFTLGIFFNCTMQKIKWLGRNQVHWYIYTIVCIFSHLNNFFVFSTWNACVCIYWILLK